jgi:hypothetical protein
VPVTVGTFESTLSLLQLISDPFLPGFYPVFTRFLPGFYPFPTRFSPSCALHPTRRKAR